MSTYSEASGGPAWQISSMCDTGTCVGVAREGEFVLMGNTADPDGPVSRFTLEEWNAFIVGAKLGNFDDLA